MDFVPIAYAKKVCRLGQGNLCCRYVGGAAGGMICLKHDTLAKQLDDRVADKTMVARGNNCDGWSKLNEAQKRDF